MHGVGTGHGDGAEEAAQHAAVVGVVGNIGQSFKLNMVGLCRGSIAKLTPAADSSASHRRICIKTMQ